MTGSPDRWSDHPGSDEVGEAIIWRVERGESGNRTTPIGHDHFFAGPHEVDVLTQPVLEIANPDLRPQSSYFHVFIVAIKEQLSTGNPSAPRRSATHIDTKMIYPGQHWTQAGGAFITIIGLARHTVPDTTLWLVRRVGQRDVIMSEGYIWMHYQLSRSGTRASCGLVSCGLV